MLIFKNNGHINLEAITTFGVSSKENANAIGYFGTGLKYAIAILLREKAKVTLYIGLEKYEFTTQTKTIRVNEFEFIQMNGKDLAFTTELGKNWELWQAYRELYCNCQDENGLTYINSEFTPKEGTTMVIVESEKVEKIHLENHDIILKSEPIEVLPRLEIHKNPSDFIYYKNIRISKLNKPSKFTYNFTSNVDLTEDRTVKNSYLLNSQWVRSVSMLENARIIKEILTKVGDNFEGTHDFDYHSLSTSNTFLETITTLVKERAVGLNPTIRRLVFGKTNLESSMYEDLKLTKVQVKCVNKAIDFLKKLGCNVEEYPIRYVKELGNNVLGLAKDGTIFISDRCLMMGTKMVTGTLLEEYIHLKLHLIDESRDMQNYLFDKVISLAEELLEVSL